MKSPHLSARTAAVALALVPLFAQARLDSPVTSRAEQHAQNALAHRRSPRAAAYLIRLHGLRDEVDDLNLLADPYARLMTGHGTDPLVRATARMLYADVERARGNLTKAKSLLAPLGFVQQFYVLGSFDNEGKSGCNTDFGPEGAAIDLSAHYPAKGHEAHWLKVPVSSLDGYVDLSAMVRPNREAVAYALTFLEAPEDTRAQLSLGTSGAFRLWVNGQLAASEDRYNHPRPDQARVAVRLRRGMNRVLLKMCQENGPLGFYLRAERGEGGRVAPRVVLPDAVPPLEKGASPSPVALPTLTSALARQVARSPSDAMLRADYATVLAHFRAFDEREKSDVEEAEKAAELAPQDPEVQLVAAQLHHDDHNLRRKRIEAALRASPEAPFAKLMLAQLELAVDHPERALPLLAELVTRHPRFGPARFLQIRAAEELGESARAHALAEAVLRELPHLPGSLREAARAARRLDRHQETLERSRTALALRFDDRGTRRAIADLLADLGRTDEAARQLELLLKLDPFDNASRVRLAELYAANGRMPDAEKLFAQAKQLSPDEPEVHEREGRTLLQAQRRDEAVAAFQRSLELRPQNPGLREALRTLLGEDAAMGAQFAVDVAPLLPEAQAHASEDAVYLADYTYVRVQPSGQSSRFRQLAVKVFTQRGADAFRSIPITYAPSRQEVRILQARLTKPDGSVIESYGENDRHMNEPWTGMYYDTRTKALSFPSIAPGDVLELRYRLDDTALENLLSDYWGDVEYVQGTYPKLRFQYFVDMPAARKLYWNKSRLPESVVSREDPEKDGRVLYRFSSQNVAKVLPEPSMPGWAEVATTLHVSTYQTWDQVGRYYWGLVRDQLTPTEELRRTVDTVLKGVDRKDELAVIRAIYNFVVSNTRYVALEFGIHGYKPYRVDRVLARRFGDCKDKASLIHAMLKLAGVESRLVLLRMRHLGGIGGEPASLAAFNHAIAYVPKYELFLDGTAEFHASRELPSADRAADVLIVEPNGKSPFLSTPESRAEDNLVHLEMDVKLAPDGSAAVTGKSTVTGQHAPEYRRAYQAPATRKATFEQGWAQTFPGLKVKAMTISEPSQLDSDVKLGFELQVPRYAEVLPQGLRFFPFGSGRTYTQAYAPLAERKFDLVMSGPWVNTFTFRYELPRGLAVTELPPEVREDTPFGRLRMRHRVEDGKLVCEAEVAFTVARVKVSDYPAFRAWLGRVDQAFARRLFAGAAPQSATR